MGESPEHNNNATPGAGTSSWRTQNNATPGAGTSSWRTQNNALSGIPSVDESPASRRDVTEAARGPDPLIRKPEPMPSNFSLQRHIHSDKEVFSFLAEFSTEGGHHGLSQVLVYDLRKLVKVGGLISMFCHGSVFRIDMSWVMDALATAVIALSVAAFSHAVNTLSDEITLSVEIIENLVYQASQLVPVVLGFYVSVAFYRWWHLREDALGSVFEAIVDICMMMACALPDVDVVHEYVARMGLASIELLTQAARIEPGLENLVERGLLTSEEGDLLEQSEPWSRVFMVWAWILRVAAEELNDKGPRAAALYGKCMQARQGILLVHKSHWSQLPFAYVHLQAWLVSAHNLVIAVRVGLGIAVSWEKGEYPTCVIELFLGVVLCVIYRGVLSITHLIHDPFGPTSTGFPMAAYTGYVAASIDAVQTAQRKCPAVERLRQQEEGATTA